MLAMEALWRHPEGGRGLGVPAGDPRGGSGLLCAKPLYRAVKYNMFAVKRKKKN